jgi:hypothetical protein
VDVSFVNKRPRMNEANDMQCLCAIQRTASVFLVAPREPLYLVQAEPAYKVFMNP